MTTKRDRIKQALTIDSLKPEIEADHDPAQEEVVDDDDDRKIRDERFIDDDLDLDGTEITRADGTKITYTPT